MGNLSKDEKEIHEAVIRMRGEIIDASAFIEKMVDLCLAKYFCNKREKQSDIIAYILSTRRMIFNSKVDALSLIVSDKYPDFNKKHKKLFKAIKASAVEERNILAHSVWDSSMGYIERFKKEGIIRMAKLERTKSEKDITFVNYDSKKIAAIKLKMSECINGLEALLEIIENK